MNTANTYVRASLDTATKERAVEAPSKSSRKALAEIAAGKVKTFASVDDLMADLNAYLQK